MYGAEGRYRNLGAELHTARLRSERPELNSGVSELRNGPIGTGALERIMRTAAVHPTCPVSYSVR